MNDNADGFNENPTVSKPWWNNWCDMGREEVRGLIEAATDQALALSDPLPDTLIAHAQQLGMWPFELRFFISDKPARTDWTIDALSAFAQRYGMDRALRRGDLQKAAAPTVEENGQ